MKILGIIPARYASTRFPGKPLADINGKSMITRVCEQAAKAGVLEEVLVATDDERIMQHVIDSGFKAIMTSSGHQSGTERCLEALQSYNLHRDLPARAVINIQGDEPFIHPEQILKVAALLIEEQAEIATLAKKVNDYEALVNPNIVKVVFTSQKDALYFSRLPLPYLRNVDMPYWTAQALHYQHIGIYGYTAAVLEKICRLPAGKLETAESLEQLRWLENGYRIKIGITDHESMSVDTPEDLLKITNSA